MMLLFVTLAVLAVLYYKVRIGRYTKGIEIMHTSQWGLGGTWVVANEVVRKEAVTMFAYFAKAIKHHGYRPFQWSAICGKHFLVLNHPDDIKCISKDPNSCFIKGPIAYEILKIYFGDGIIMANGESWKSQRHIMSHMFSRRLLRERMSTVFGTHAQDLVNVFRKAAQSGMVFNVQVPFYCYTFDCINMVAFNCEVNALGGVQSDVEFQHAFDVLQNRITDRFVTPLWQFFAKFQLTESERQISKTTGIVNEHIHKILDSYYNEAGEISDALEGDQTITGLYLEAAKLEGITYSRKFLRDLVFNTLAAGRDTTASALTSCIQYLCDHPEWQDKLGAEAKEVFNGNTQEALTFDDVEGRSPIAEAIFLESLRLNPAAPFNERYCVKEVTFPSGAKAYPGDAVQWYPIVTNRLKEFWGEDAEEWDPSRWLDGKAKNYDEFMYTAFHSGPHMCIGKPLAMLEGKIALLTLFAHFRFTKKEGFKTRVVNSMTYTNDANGMQVYIRECDQMTN
eukprot:TRINITY_DN129_c0_g1_i1.p1 TRINITY_DN129_c0_g1~~TRINITY_DN129_c0_g1_i1.p1  ORF type:complete len:521 (+),score=222.93 TRINITY_DN129_c0_g1_i1:42-1565(+)